MKDDRIWYEEVKRSILGGDFVCRKARAHSPECESEMGKRRNSWTRLCPQFGTVCGPFLGFSSNLFFAKPSFTPEEMRVDEKEASKVGKVIFP